MQEMLMESRQHMHVYEHAHPNMHVPRSPVVAFPAVMPFRFGAHAPMRKSTDAQHDPVPECHPDARVHLQEFGWIASAQHDANPFRRILFASQA